MAQFENGAERVPMAAQLARYAPGFRPALAACAELSPRIAQLAWTHPVLLFALATRYGPVEPRRHAVQLAVDGRGLAEVSKAMGLPLCFKRIPPEALSQPLPYALWGADANRQLAPHLPVEAGAAGFWLAGISFAARYGDEEFAFWLARQLHLIDPRCMEIGALLPLALFAWASRHGEHLGLPPLMRPWSPRLGLRTVLTRTSAWLHGIRLQAKPDQSRRPDPWLPGGMFRGFEFKALMTPKALRGEARAMDNCVHTYFDAIEEDLLRLFSVRQCKRRIATLEIRRSEAKVEYTVTQLKGPSNRNCALEVWQVVTAWLDHSNRLAAASAPQLAQPTDNRLLADLLALHRRDLGLGADTHLRGVTLPALFMSVRRVKACVGQPRQV